MFEQWTSRAAGLERVGTILLHKFDQRLFRRSTRNACESQLMDGQFADDAVFLATTRAGAEQAMRLYVLYGSECWVPLRDTSSVSTPSITYASALSWASQTGSSGSSTSPPRRWRDLILRDLKVVGVGVPEEKWHDWVSWRQTYSQGLEQYGQQQPSCDQPQGQVQCPECRRCFRREGDRARHKCTSERQKLVREQRGGAIRPTAAQS